MAEEEEEGANYKFYIFLNHAHFFLSTKLISLPTNLLMNRTCMSIAYLLDTLPTDQNTPPPPRNIFTEISNMNDNAGVNNSSESSVVTSISNTNQKRNSWQ